MSDVKQVFLPVGTPDRYGWILVGSDTLTILDRTLLQHLASWNTGPMDHNPRPEVRQLIGDYLVKKPSEAEAQRGNPEIVTLENQLRLLSQEKIGLNNEIAALSEKIEDLFDDLTDKNNQFDAVHLKIRRAYRKQSLRKS
ncbi:hypothetical protein D3C76_28010 [compost metagenome]